MNELIWFCKKHGYYITVNINVNKPELEIHITYPHDVYAGTSTFAVGDLDLESLAAYTLSSIESTEEENND